MRIGILTSGGDAPGMNAAIRAATVVTIALGHEPIGVRHGYQGLIDGELEPLELAHVADVEVAVEADRDRRRIAEEHPARDRYRRGVRCVSRS